MITGKTVIKLIALSLTMAISLSPLFSQEVSPETGKTEKTEEKAGENSSEKKEETTKTEVLEHNKTVKKEEEPAKLKNPELLQMYKDHSDEPVPVLFFNNFGYGLLSGAVLGMLGSLSTYQAGSSMNQTYLLMFAGIGGATGGVFSIGISIAELLAHSPYRYGMKYFKLTWYGASAGFLGGAITGMFFMQSREDFSPLFKGIGYGSLGGAATGLLLAFILPEKAANKVTFSVNGDQTLLALHFKFN